MYALTSREYISNSKVFLDDLPARNFLGRLDEGGLFPHEHKVFLYTHHHFIFEYNGPNVSPTFSEIVRSKPEKQKEGKAKKSHTNSSLH